MKHPVVFLLDDDPGFRKLIASSLQTAGFEVFEAPRLATARTKYKRGDYDLLIVDGLLPDGSGVAWLEELRRDGDLTPAIFVSAFWKDMRTFIKLTRDLHVDAVFAKPLAPKELVQTAWKILGGPLPAPAEGRETDEIVFGAPVANPFDTNADPAIENSVDIHLLAEAELRQLVDSYAAALPEKWQLLSDALQRFQDQPTDEGLRDAARQRAHKLFGTAGSYGFHKISQAAAEIEAALLAGKDSLWDVIHGAILQGRRHLPVPPDEAKAVLRPPLVATILVADEDPAFLDEIREWGRDMNAYGANGADA